MKRYRNFLKTSIRGNKSSNFWLLTLSTLVSSNSLLGFYIFDIHPIPSLCWGLCVHIFLFTHWSLWNWSLVDVLIWIITLSCSNSFAVSACPSAACGWLLSSFFYHCLNWLHRDVKSTSRNGRGIPQSLRAFARVLCSTSPQGLHHILLFVVLIYYTAGIHIGHSCICK